ncbi:hypothetical protein BJV74DRAFT_796390 [Russula compacta]|nr:hypothetical protein BJV74DRAFT_796390 [Russula compacta]
MPASSPPIITAFAPGARAWAMWPTLEMPLSAIMGTPKHTQTHLQSGSTPPEADMSQGSNPVNSIFNVEIAGNEYVSRILKDLVKEKTAPHCNGIAAKDLLLWKSSVPIDDDLATTLSRLDFEHPDDGLDIQMPGGMRLSRYFGDGVPADHVHVIVESTNPTEPLLLTCYILGDAPQKLFDVNISKTESVMYLRDMINEKVLSHFKDISSMDLELWKCSIPFDEHYAKTLEDLDVDQPDSRLITYMRGGLVLSHYFRDNVLKQNLRVIVHARTITDGRGKKRKREEDDLPPTVKLLKKQVGNAPPLSLAYPSQFRNIAGPGHAICRNRPFEYDTIPLVLLHEAFGMFKDGCEAAPSEKALACLGGLTTVACHWQEDEADRSSIVMPAAIRECKMEHGDALDQVILVYGNFLIQALEDPLRFYNFNTRFPSVFGFLWCRVGWHACEGRASHAHLRSDDELETKGKTEMRSHLVWMHSRSPLTISKGTTARSIEAEANSNTSRSKSNTTPVFRKLAHYPFRDVLQRQRTGNRGVLRMMNDYDETKLIFSAPSSTKTSLWRVHREIHKCRYSEAAHDHLASRGWAAGRALRKCVSHLWRLVRDHHGTDRTISVADWHDSQEGRARKRKDTIRGKVKRIVETPARGWASFMGDIRHVNILVDGESLGSEDVKIHIIDFDWAGRVGEAKYPIEINRMTVWRPVGVNGGELITKQHDIDMVSYLFTGGRSGGGL